MTKTIIVPLRQAAHGRSGDKGNRSNLSVIAYRAELFPVLVEQITEQAVAGHFAFRRPTRVVRHVLPKLHALNFVLDDVLDGGVNDALNLDAHGKTLAFHLLALPIEVPVGLASLLRGTADSRPSFAKENR